MIYWVYSCDYSLLEAPWSKLLALLDFIHISYYEILLLIFILGGWMGIYIKTNSAKLELGLVLG